MIAPCKPWSAFLNVVPLCVGIASRPSNAQTCAVEWELPAPPGTHQEHAMAYDSARGVTVLFGGYDYDPDFGGTYLAETWEWDGVTWTQKSTTGPTPRAGHAMAYDSQRGVTVLFGGGYYDYGTQLSQFFGDTWEWDGTNWTPRSTTGPAARADHAMAFDSARGVTVLFAGGYETSGYEFFGDTWEWDGANWTLRSETGPGPRGAHALAFDSGRSVTVLFGGGSGPYYNGPTFGDTWEWDGSIWTCRSNFGPSPRIGHAMAYDTLRGVSVLFGGWGYDQYGGTLDGRTWIWNGAAWWVRADSGPMGQSGHAMAYDSQRGVTVLQGNWTPDWVPRLPSTWEWDGTNWTQVAHPCKRWSRHSATTPSQFFTSGMVFDESRAVTVLFGGSANGYVGDTWEWDGSVWSFRTNTGPSPRALHDMAYDRRRGVSVLFGGRSGSYPNLIYHNDTWEWDGRSWTLRSTIGPSPRGDLAMAYDDARGVVVLFSGYFDDPAADAPTMFGDTWEWDGVDWTLRSTTGPPPRSGHAMVYDSARGVTVLFGGVSNNCGEYGCEFLDDTWEWDGTTWTFRCTGGPSWRADHAMAYDSGRDVTVLFGGVEYDILVADTWEWDGGAWRQKSVGGPSARGGHSMAYDTARGVVWMYGGEYFFGGEGEVWDYGCHCVDAASVVLAEAYSPCPGTCYPTKNRYLSFAPPPSPCGTGSVALRVTFGPMPGASDCPKVLDYSIFDGTQMWVGPEVLRNGVTPTGVYKLQSTPLFRDWTTVAGGVIQLSDCNIVPCATYTIDAISNVDYPAGPYSPPLVLTTTQVWGDIVSHSYGPADGIVDAIDVTAMVDRFKSAPGAPPASWCDVYGNQPTQGVNFNIDALDIVLIVDAFKGFDYPFSGPVAPGPCP
ncbi:MAG: kelch repeat-containing protein [Planctomycetota bacterium]